MKQTNNAIKFLVAQYRAIFKNANIAMFAAIAAAALAAGQAQAATAFDNDKLQALSGGETITLDGKSDGADGKYSHLNLSGAAADGVVKSEAFTLKITAGNKNVISGSAAHTDILKAENATLQIEAAEGNAADTKLEIGNTSGAVVTFKDVAVTKGQLELTKGSLSAQNINFGKNGAQKAMLL